MCSCEFDTPDFFHSAKHKSRSPRKCNECNRLIEKGENYERIYAKWDDVYVINLCAQCVEIRDTLMDEIDCFCFAYDRLIEDAKNHLKEIAQEDSRGLKFKIGRLIVQSKKIRRAQHGNAQL